MLKRLVKQGNHYNNLSLPEESCKQKWRTLSENGRPEMIAENGRFPSEMGGLESLHLKSLTKLYLKPRAYKWDALLLSMHS